MKTQHVFSRRTTVWICSVIGVVAFASFLTLRNNRSHDPYGLDAEAKKEDTKFWQSELKREQDLDRSQVIAYASVGTPKLEYNWTLQLQLECIEFTITEIWKGSRVASKLGITNGTHMKQSYWPGTDVSGDGAILYWGADGSCRSLEVVHNGRIYRSNPSKGMTLQEYKRKLGT